jgi:hypothetical protein
MGKGIVGVITGDMFALTGLLFLADGLDTFRLGSIVTGGKKNPSGRLPCTKRTLVGWISGS